MRLIDADKLLDVYERNSITDIITVCDKTVRQHLKDAPTIDAVPVVHAQWRYKVAYAAHVNVTNIIYCTACGKGFHRIEGENFNFCPNCGARMDGGAE
jgi:hypothetical protein